MAGVEQVVDKSAAAAGDTVPQPPSQGRVLLKLFIHSIAMFTLPIIAYYCSKDFLEKEYGIEQPKSSIYGAISAVVIIQVIIFSYIYQAFLEENNTKKVKCT